MEIQKIRKINENISYWRRKPSYLLNDFRNFNEIFRKDLAYDIIKSDKKAAFHPLSRKNIFGKTTGGGQPSIFRVKYIRKKHLYLTHIAFYNNFLYFHNWLIVSFL